jgi:photosystem II stability/assembly factor-like uncharacterized protein
MKQIHFVVFIWFLLINIACDKHDNVGVPNELWQKLNTPYFGRISDIQFTSSDTGYIMGYDTTAPGGTTILKTFDGGQSWQKIYFSPTIPTNATIKPIGPLNVSPFNSNILFSECYGSTKIVRSTDGGYDWKIIDSTQSPASWGRYHFFSPANILRSGEFIYMSTDSGFTWTKVYDSKGGFAFFTMLQFTSNQTGYTSGGISFDGNDGGLMAKTIDGGKTWQPVNYAFRNILGMSFISDNTGYIVMDRDPESNSSESVLYKTQDGGNTWKPVNKQLNWGGYDLYFRNEQDGFTYGKGGIFHTTDGGQSWRNELKDAIDDPIFKLYFPNASRGYVIDENGNVYKRTL